MAYHGQPPQGDWVSGEQHRYLHANFRIAHEKVEEQRQQLLEQEKQVALLRARIATLEGSEDPHAGDRIAGQKQGGTSVDDWSIKNAASKLEKLINRWAADIIRAPPVPLDEIVGAIITDIPGGSDVEGSLTATPMVSQSLLRHAMAETISEGIVNCLIVTSSPEANIQLTRIHEHLFARDPTVACVWRRQTFSAAVEACSPEMSQQILADTIPTLAQLLAADLPAFNAILDAAYGFSRMLHGSKSSSGGVTDTFYRAFVPELGSTLYPRQIELIKRCLQSENNGVCRVGATVFPGLVKVSKGPVGQDGKTADMVQTVVRRAQVICECALGPPAGNFVGNPGHPPAVNY